MRMIERSNNNRKQGLVRADSLLILLIVIMYLIILGIGLKQDDAAAGISIRKATICFCVWFLFSIISRYNSLRVHYFIICVIAVWGGYESLKGLIQIISHNTYYYGSNSAGSFLNPGPYGGFLACIISVLIPSIYKTKRNDKLIIKLYSGLLLLVIILSVVILSFTNSRAAVLSLVASMLVFLLRTRKGKLLFKRFCLPLCIIASIACVWGYYAKKQSADGRVFMDKICMKAIVENNVMGAGLGHFRKAYQGSQYNYYKKDISIKNGIIETGLSEQKDRQKAWEPNSAFNMVLLIGVEMGPITMIIFITIVFLTTILLYRRNNELLYGFLTISIFGMFSYPLVIWQFQLLYSILIASASYSKELEVSAIKNKNTICMLITISTVLFLCMRNAISTSRSHREWIKDRVLLELKSYDLFAESCSEKEKRLNYIDDFMMEYGYVLSKIGLVEKSDSVLKVCQSYQSSPGLLILLGENCMNRGDYCAAENYFIDAFVMLPDRIKPLYELANLYVLKGDTVAALNVINSANNYSFKIESGWTRDYRIKMKTIENRITNSILSNQE
ncbi:MAG: hypothetical protein IKM90_04015 [Bacteroidaceae bacterium]|nr:hypothetical protein [Bacteroidaceae bacterium]